LQRSSPEMNASSAANTGHTSAAKATFLMYHELEEPGRSLCDVDPGYVRYIVSSSDFRAQMQSLKKSGQPGIGVSQALLPGSFDLAKPVVITFDDGSETDLIVAAPILKEFGFGATFYVTAGFVGNEGILSHRQVRELRELGFDVGCHSMTHAYLADLDRAALKIEIVDAKDMLEQMTGSPVDHFSCPGGRYDQRVIEIAREAGYKSLATSRVTANSKTADPFSLGRVAIMRHTTLDSFEAICRGQGLWRLQLSETLRGTLKRVLGNSAYDRMRAALLRRGSAPD